MIKFTFTNGWAAYGESVFGSYPAGEPLLKIPYSSLKDLTAVEVRSTSIAELMNALFAVDAARERGCGDVELVLPYVPGGRQDRLNDEGDLLFTLKSVASEINHRNFSNVFVLDPHSDVTTALIDRCQVMPLLNKAIGNKLVAGNYDGVIIPDAGASKRATTIAKALGVPTFQAWKKRDIMTGKLSGFGIEQLPIRANKFLIVDDICDGGGTFLGLAALPEFKVRLLDLYVTHGIFTQGLAKLGDAFDTIYTTNSIEPVDVSGDATLIVFHRF